MISNSLNPSMSGMCTSLSTMSNSSFRVRRISSAVLAVEHAVTVRSTASSSFRQSSRSFRRVARRVISRPICQPLARPGLGPRVSSDEGPIPNRTPRAPRASVRASIARPRTIERIPSHRSPPRSRSRRRVFRRRVVSTSGRNARAPSVAPLYLHAFSIFSTTFRHNKSSSTTKTPSPAGKSFFSTILLGAVAIARDGSRAAR